jgi:hypothetical protein
VQKVTVPEKILRLLREARVLRSVMRLQGLSEQRSKRSPRFENSCSIEVFAQAR